MGKRSNFERVDKDKYDTIDPRAVPPLLSHLKLKTFTEPCAGKGYLIDALSAHGMRCEYACDIEHDGFGINQQDAFTLKVASQIITNPPWSRKILHPMIEHFLTLQCDVWLLFDAGWMFSEQAAPYLKNCREIIALPRLQWVRDSAYSAKDDCCWYLFSPFASETVFINERGL